MSAPEAASAARFPAVGLSKGHYESFYVKATRPGGGQAIWLRQTIHKPPGEPPTGSLWLTLFDAAAPGPRAAKLTVPAPSVSVPEHGYVEIAGARLTPEGARGGFEARGTSVAWELELERRAEPFHHLPHPLMYRASLPRTKLLSPIPDARCLGTVSFGGERIELDGWFAMVGHNWGAEHAERWSWIQANDLKGGSGWFDAGLGRIRIGRWTTPWIGNAMLSLDGELHRLGGLDRVRSTRLADSPTGAEFALDGRGIRVRGRVGSQARNFVAWVYADPDGGEHNSINCSISDLELEVEREGRPPQTLACAGAAAYELGVRETDHGIPLQPYGDG